MASVICLETRDLSVGYPRHQVLCEVCLSLGTKRVALLGANGSGKTTLLRVLSGALRPGTGAVVVNGEDLRYGRRALTEYRQLVQLVLQDPDDQLFSAEVASDVSFGPMNLGLPEDQTRGRVEESLSLLGIEHLAERPTHQLSHGEAKRVAIAGALAMRPQLLLLDEPTAGLDPVGVTELLAALDGLEAHGTQVVLSTHDVDLALAWADSVAVVADGTVCSGDPVALLDDPALLARARLRRPWPLELHRRLVESGRLPADSAAPRSLDDLATIMGAG